MFLFRCTVDFHAAMAAPTQQISEGGQTARGGLTNKASCERACTGKNRAHAVKMWLNTQATNDGSFSHSRTSIFSDDTEGDSAIVRTYSRNIRTSGGVG